MEFQLIVYAVTLSLLFALGDCSSQSHQYMAYPEDEFSFYKNVFNCSASQTILFETIILEIHPPSRQSCEAYIGKSEALKFWLAINNCINNGTSPIVEGCEVNAELQTVIYKVDPRLIVLDDYVILPCGDKEDVEILQMVLHYTCPELDEMPDWGNHHPGGGGILTVPHSLPPRGMSTPPELPPTDSVTPKPDSTPTSTTARPPITKLTTRIRSTAHQSSKKPTKTTPKYIVKSDSQLTAHQFAVIVGPVVAVVLVVIIVLTFIILCCVKRKSKVWCLQGGNLFSRRQSSTASHASDVSFDKLQLSSTNRDI